MSGQVSANQYVRAAATPTAEILTSMDTHQIITFGDTEEIDFILHDKGCLRHF